MITIEADKDDLRRIEDRLESMAQKIAHARTVDIGSTLSDWQVTDMHRRAPFTMRNKKRGTATTVIRQHSLYEMQRSAAYQRSVGRMVKRHGKNFWVKLSRAQFHVSQRPILREELLTELWQRLHTMLRDHLRWRDTLSLSARLHHESEQLKEIVRRIQALRR
jgi:hypothetical protein